MGAVGLEPAGPLTLPFPEPLPEPLPPEPEPVLSLLVSLLLPVPLPVGVVELLPVGEDLGSSPLLAGQARL